ncbi:MAG: DEAD/DEAH box helicase, partial [Nanoarchaeota archaeon]
MIKAIKEPHKAKEVEAILHPFVREWFFSKFKEFSLPQLYGVLEIHNQNNILVSAPTGSTKCVTPDTNVLIDIGGHTKLLSGEELIEMAKNNGKLLAHVDKTGELHELPNLKCYSLVKDRVEKNKAIIYFEDTKDVLLRIKTEYGREIKLSKDHPLLVEGEGWKPAGHIKVGDKIGVPRQINLPEKHISLDYRFALDRLRKNSQICIFYDDYLRLKDKTNDFNDFNELTTKEIYEIKTLTRTSFSKLSKVLGISLSLIYRLFNKKTVYKRELLFKFLKEECKKIKFEENRIIAKSRGVKTFSFIYPKTVDIKLARWLSFILAEGLIGDYKIGSHLLISQINRKALLKEFFNNSKDLFDIEFKKKSYKDYSFNSTLFCYFLRDLLSLKIGRGRYVEFPHWILNANKEIKVNFLSVFFSLECTIQKNGKEIILSQSNKKKIEAINYLLLSLGIFPAINKSIRWATNTKNKTKREYYYLIIRKIRDIKTFLELIGIDHPNKEILQKYILRKPSGEFVAKYEFDYKKIRELSRLCKNDKEFKIRFGNLYEVVRRTGFVTEIGLINLRNKLQEFNKKGSLSLIAEINGLLNSNIFWLKVKTVEKFDYEGKVVDLTVPDIHNFIGGYGGIYLHNTLTAFLAILNELVSLNTEEKLEDKTYAIYASPLKALTNDIFVNLITPLEEISEIAKKHGKELRIRVGLRTGDTTASERAKMARNAPHILVTTPESLAIVLTTLKFREYLKNVKYCIIDEIHALAENKRGVHLSLSVERLRELTGNDFCRIGLSATVSPLDEIAKYLVGTDNNCKIADVQFIKKMDLKVLSPVKDLINTSYEEQSGATYELIDNLVQEHKTTLIFTNTRAATERVVHYLKERFP